MPTTISQSTVQNLVNIYNWIEANKHKFKNGITRTPMFSGVVQLDTGGYFPDNIQTSDPLYNKYCNWMARYRRCGYIKFKQLELGKPKVIVVNEDLLPPGTVTYTGVKNSPIVLSRAEALPAEPLELAEPQLSQAETGEQFVREELKNISVSAATLRRQGVAVELADVSLFALYKIGLTLNEVTEPLAEPTSEPAAAEAKSAEPEPDDIEDDRPF